MTSIDMYSKNFQLFQFIFHCFIIFQTVTALPIRLSKSDFQNSSYRGCICVMRSCLRNTVHSWWYFLQSCFSTGGSNGVISAHTHTVDRYPGYPVPPVNYSLTSSWKFEVWSLKFESFESWINLIHGDMKTPHV